jgi:hypothetical protein
MKEALSSSETSVLTRATRRNIPEDVILHSHRRENLRSYIFYSHPSKKMDKSQGYISLWLLRRYTNREVSLHITTLKIFNFRFIKYSTDYCVKEINLPDSLASSQQSFRAMLKTQDIPMCHSHGLLILLLPLLGLYMHTNLFITLPHPTGHYNRLHNDVQRYGLNLCESRIFEMKSRKFS